MQVLTTRISNSFLSAEINHLGAELFSLQNTSNKEFMWEGNPKFWGKHSPVLFPIVGTLKNNSYTYNGFEYHLPRHGFAREMQFNLVNKSENSATFSIGATNETKRVFPFDFELQIGYTLDENKLNINYSITNKNTFIMPFSIGAHPAFALDGTFENYSLEFECQETPNYFLLENGLISNSSNEISLNSCKLPINYPLFENDALVFKALKSKSISILHQNTPFLKVHFDDFPHLGIWTVQNAPFLCIEPWLGYSDTVNASGNIIEKEGIQLLEANTTKNYSLSIELI